MKQNLLKFTIFCLCLLAGVNASAYDCIINGIYYNLDNTTKEATVTYCYDDNDMGYMGNIEIPSTITHNSVSYNVIGIDDGAFGFNEQLTSVKIAEGISVIGSYAFYGCENLKTIKIPASITSLGEDAFSGCYNLESIDLSATKITVIEAGTFHDCENIVSIKLPEGLTTIKEGAFEQCEGMTEINIPQSVTVIEEDAFGWCESLTSLELPEGITTIEPCTFQFCMYLNTIKIPSTVTYIGYKAFNCLGGWATNISFYSYATKPPVAYDNSDGIHEHRDFDCSCAFSEFDFQCATLYVPKGCKGAYQSAEVWKEFKNIIEFEVETGVEQKQAVKSTMAGRYSINGNKLDAPQKGINIIRMSDGSVKKVIVK